MGVSAKAKADPTVKKPGGKRKLILILATVLVLAAAAGGWFSGLVPRLLHRGEAEHLEAAAAPAHAAPVFMELPDIVANLNSGNRRNAFIKLKARVELSKHEDELAVQAAMPRVLDLFQGYLREMRPEELRGTAGTYRLREELVARINIAAHPARVLNVLFTELLVQ